MSARDLCTLIACVVIVSFIDRYVLLGNHRDAWVFGAIDPSSGTAALMEASRVFANMVKKGEHIFNCLTVTMDW